MGGAGYWAFPGPKRFPFPHSIMSS